VNDCQAVIRVAVGSSQMSVLDIAVEAGYFGERSSQKLRRGGGQSPAPGKATL